MGGGAGGEGGGAEADANALEDVVAEGEEVLVGLVREELGLHVCWRWRWRRRCRRRGRDRERFQCDEWNVGDGDETDPVSSAVGLVLVLDEDVLAFAAAFGADRAKDGGHREELRGEASCEVAGAVTGVLGVVLVEGDGGSVGV